MGHGHWCGARLVWRCSNYATLALAGRPWASLRRSPCGRQGGERFGCGRSAWAFWQMPGNAKALAAPVCGGHHQRHGHRHRPWCAVGRRPGWRFAPSLRSWPLVDRCGDRRPAARLRFAPGVRLQHRRVLQRHRLGSLHGWVWLVAAFTGNSVGVRLRPIFLCGRAPSGGAERLLSQSCGETLGA